MKTRIFDELDIKNFLKLVVIILVVIYQNKWYPRQENERGTTAKQKLNFYYTESGSFAEIFDLGSLNLIPQVAVASVNSLPQSISPLLLIKLAIFKLTTALFK